MALAKLAPHVRIACILHLLAHLLVQKDELVIEVVVIVFKAHNSTHERRILRDLLSNLLGHLVLRDERSLRINLCPIVFGGALGTWWLIFGRTRVLSRRVIFPFDFRYFDTPF